MESGGSFNTKRKYTTKAPTSGIVIGATTNIPAVASDANVQQFFKRDADQYMPIANIIRIMRRTLPVHAKIADDAKETIQECVSEFISFITSEANKKCHQEYRKTITPEDVLSAMETLGFNNYIEPLTIFLKKYHARDSHSSSQPTLLVKRNMSYLRQPTAEMARPPPPPPQPPFTMAYDPMQLPNTHQMAPPLPTPSIPLPFPMGYCPTQLITANTMDYGSYIEFSQMKDYYKENQGGGEGSSSLLEFHPFEPFK
ncbi:hypothetical protein CDL12_18757 [Handroanthus impetiginosus]|uniref:Transcription factor CBF/NF-Y/archaeal histone domain-containing protein n=1 Tax=Handroanthus impetiginosus TaxID=429701 RepID=A0A2G9GTR3_9LAMI|nr:hypothetical protein CDL12_18757 [Handroanthus impetiginosus]